MAAQGAELKLRVSLDLTSLRRQLSTIGTELSGQGIYVPVKFDRKIIANEFRLLDRYVGNKKFNIEINSNLSAELDKVRKLSDAIRNLPKGGGPTGAIGIVQTGFTQTKLRSLGEDIKPLYRAAADAGLIAFNQAIANNQAKIAKALSEVGQDSIAGLLNGLSSGDARLRAAAESLGGNLIATLKSTLGIASPSKETAKLGKFAAEGFEKGFVSGMVKAERTMAIAIRSAVIGAIREGLSNLPGMGGALVGFERQLAASVQLAVRKAMREGLSASVLPGAKGTLLGGAGGAATGATIGGAKALGGGVAGGVAKLTAGGLMGTAANLARYSLDSSAYQEFVGKLYEEIIKAALSSGTQGAVIGALAVGGVAGGLGFARGATGSLVLQAITGIRNRILAALLAVSSGAMSNVVQVMVRDVTNTLFRGIQRQLQAATASLPAVNWPSSRPMTQGATTVSTKALAPGRQFPELPGSAFASQKRLVGDILNAGLKEALRGAANAFVDAVRNGLNSAVRAVRVKDLGAPMQPALRAGRVAGLLPAGVGREAATYSTGRLGRDGESRAEMLARREREARVRSALRAVDVMGGGAGRAPAPYSQAYRAARPTGAIVPYAAGGALVPSFVGGGGGAGGGGTGGGGGGGRGPSGGPGGGFFGALSKLSLPGTGTINALGTEFAFATKQVLLFGQAYKLLAFIQDFPGQVGNAVSQLQSFRNTLNAISPTAADAAASNQLILDTVEKYNIPIQSARDGFTKLYASMKPAGFSGEQIGKLFIGISQASAALGLSGDKVDRVTYAFSQMASKGQLMAEEVSGQLGDVIPGALSIMAEAANMDIKTFKKAMEDGVFVGDAFAAVMSNVPIVMERRFGKGAEGAAKTFQGAINNMQTSLTLFYQSFEPVAVGFLNTVVVPLTNGIKTVTDGFNAFFTNTAAQTAGGQAFAAQLKELKPSFDGILANLQQLMPTIQLFGSVLLNAGKLLASIAGNPITGFLLKLYANILLVNTAFTLLGGRVLVGLISGIGTAISRFIAMNVAMASLQRTSAVTNSTFAGTQLQMAMLTRGAAGAIGPVTALKTALMGLANMGLIAIAIQVTISGIEEINRLKQSLNDIAGFSSKEYKKQVQGMSREAVNSAIIVNRRTQAAIQTELAQYKGPIGTAKGLVTGRDEELRARLLKVQTQEAVLSTGRKNRTQSELSQAGVASAMSPIPEAPGDGKNKKGKKAANEASKLQEEIARQAMAASDVLFAEQQRLSIMQQINPTAKAITEYTSQELTIQRDLNKELGEAKSKKEKEDRIEIAKIKSANNLLDLQEKINTARENAMQPITDMLKSQEEQRKVDADIQSLLETGMNPERAKQVAEVRKLIRAQLESFDLLQDEAKQAIVAAEARGASAEQMDKLRKILQGIEDDRKKAEGQQPKAEQGVPETPETKPKTPSQYITEGLEDAKKQLAELMNIGYQVVQAANAIGDAFATSFKGLITGSMTAQQALAGFFQSVADHFADMAAKMIAEWVKMQIIGLAQSLLGNIFGGGFGSIAPGPVAKSAGVVPKAGFMGPAFANGGIAIGGFKAFADGGMVSGPTLGLVGEGRYNEAVVPLPNGRSIPVDMGGDMGGAGNQIVSNITVNVNNGQAQSNGTGSNASDFGRKMEGAVKQVIVNELRPGGVLARR